ncbi:2-dehydropantoate 2-reductase (Ketopantoate reductase) (KPA reductase) (KPR) [Neocucurbitaria cava]|uniref:2-dehydropantoate 2-reductase n=1 Tax=Neocucurbitaria cava TaxID=798079 RepID=A0A9W8YEP5_9PLEO|nr:2-dehydropantoate 2-reductase (Ketopantoate reductase) (KPA reductase) (KPR) [Neocucurbitaria cava]
MTSWKNAEKVQAEEAAEKSEDAADEHAGPKISSNAADFYRAQPVLDRRIHIMGVGNVGSFIAHALRGLKNPPPVTLIFSNWEKLTKWNESAKKLTLTTDGDAETQDGYEAEIAIPRIRFHGKEVGLNTDSQASSEPSSESPNQAPQILSGESTALISSLIICSKAPHVLQGLSAVKHRLHKDSVVLFMQNGMGIVEEVNKEVFPDPATRPYYMLGINSHGMHSTPGDMFTTVHAGFGTISLGILPHERERKADAPYTPDLKFQANPNKAPVYPKLPEELNPDYPPPATTAFKWTPNQRYLLRTLLRAPVLSATSFSPPDLLQMQLEKLAVNCVINPLTVLLDARNGSILYNYALTRTLRLLLAEISLVIRSLPELQYIPNVSQRFDPGRLETRVVNVAQLTKDNISSMLADVRGGRQTEIDYINGWIVQRGEELGIRCMCNYMMMQLVKGKANMVKLETGEGVPFVQDGKQERDGNLKVKEGMASKKDL